MTEITFSKKQLNPVINKFSIDVENNIDFHNIITLFQGQTPYQIWAIKLIFGQVCNMEVVEKIHEWATANQTEIKNLIKGNIISYSTQTELTGLFNEMRGLTLLKEIRNGVNVFNTRQRNMLSDALLRNENGLMMNGLEAFTKRAMLDEWANIFRHVNRIASGRRHKLISTSSALESVEAIKDHITNALTETYDWNRDDLLSYVTSKTSDCDVVYDKDNIVVLNVPSFNSSRALCGKGRTSWCLTREASYFDRYVKNNRGCKQFFLFDFNLKENHPLAHIGFTVKDKKNIVNAHATDNTCMLNGVRVDGKIFTIHQALNRVNIPKSVFLGINKPKYSWDIETITKIIKNKSHVVVKYHENNRLICQVNDFETAKLFVGHTSIDSAFYTPQDKKCIWILFDFNLDVNNDNSIIVMTLEKDRYGALSLKYIVDIFAQKLDKEYLNSVGIDYNSMLSFEDIDINVLLHKFINERNEKYAINLVKENKKIDINFSFENRLPIFAAIENKMLDLFEAIINHPSFNFATTDGYGETILSTLLYTYMMDINSKEKENVKKMINIILDSKNTDFNVQNINFDTVVNIACEYEALTWVAERLIGNPNVNVNVVNDFNCTALGNAIRTKNKLALRLLGTRTDVVIREHDRKIAQQNGINISDYIAPNNNSESMCLITEDTIDLSDIFAQAFAS